MSAYEEKRQRRIERLKGRAARLKGQATATHDRAHKMADIIPLGQPILVGHHSERRDRNYRDKIHRTFGRAFELHEKAKEAEARAHAAETNDAISSDDPEAVTKLRDKLAELERTQALHKAINKIVLPLAPPRRGEQGKPGWPERAIERLLAAGLVEKRETAEKLTKPDFAGRYGIPDYDLKNRNAEIRRVKQRIELLTKAAAAPVHEPVTIGDATVSEDRELNRVQIRFPGKPEAQIRKELKGTGLRWAPSEDAWQRQAGPGVWEYALRLVRRLYPDAPRSEAEDGEEIATLRRRLAGLQRFRALAEAISEIMPPSAERASGWERLAVERLIGTGLLKDAEKPAKMAAAIVRRVADGSLDLNLEQNAKALRSVKVRLAELGIAEPEPQDAEPAQKQVVGPEVAVADEPEPESGPLERGEDGGEHGEVEAPQVPKPSACTSCGSNQHRAERCPYSMDPRVRRAAEEDERAPEVVPEAEREPQMVAIRRGFTAAPPLVPCRVCGCHGDCQLGPHEVCGLLDGLCSRCAGTTGIPEVDDVAPERPVRAAQQLTFDY